MRIPSHQLASCAAFRRNLRSLGFVLVCAVVLSGVDLPAAMAQTATSPVATVRTAPMAPAAQSRAAAGHTTPGSPAQGNKGAHEGIKVSGYWKIDVHNPDGSLAKHVEFENSLSGGGPLVPILSGGLMVFGASIIVNPGGLEQGVPVIPMSVAPYTTSGGKEIPVMLPLSASGPCTSVSGPTASGANCILTTSSDPLYNNCLYVAAGATRSVSACFANLTWISGTSNQIEFDGSFIAGQEGGNVTSVGTIVSYCSQADLAGPTNCLPSVPVGSSPVADRVLGLTLYTLPTPISIGPQQAVNVSVTLSFQ